MTDSLIHVRAISQGRDAARFCEALVSQASTDPAVITSQYWSVSPAATDVPASAVDTLILRGAVLVRATGGQNANLRGGRGPSESASPIGSFGTLVSEETTSPLR